VLSSDAAGSDVFGNAVALAGDTLIVSSRYASVAAPASGAAYVFHRAGPGNWVQVNKFSAADGATLDRLGTGLSFDGTTLILAAPNNAQNGIDSGAVYLYTRTHYGYLSGTTFNDVN